MEARLCSSGLYSHNKPKKLLEDHLQSVWESAKQQLERIQFPETRENSLFSHSDLREMVRIAALYHDIGKATSFFQDYLFQADPRARAILKQKPETRHSKFSAIGAFLYAFKACRLSFEKAFVIYASILHHHGNQAKPYDDFLLGEDLDVLKKQWESIDKKKFAVLLSSVGITFPEEDFQDLLKTSQGEIYLEIHRNLLKIRNNNNPELALALQLIFSLLIDTDKFDAAGIEIPERCELPVALVDDFRTINRPAWEAGGASKSLIGIREKLYSDLNGKVENINLDNHIFSINAPTGSGKTLAGLNFALKLRERLKRERSINPRIIYCLPFLSIIEQNFSVFEDAFIKTTGKEPPRGILLKHHHLSDIEYGNYPSDDKGNPDYKGDDEFEYDIWQKKALVETWNSEIVVTTFYQFFHSLFGWRNSQLRRYHRFANSIIILDEIQAFPHRYWYLFNSISRAFAEFYNSYFILMTATIPLIFDESECKELVEGKEKLFESLSRVRILQELHRNSLESLVSEIDSNPGKSVLFILNTIASAERLYAKIKEMKRKMPLFFLSTHLTPKQRLERINKIREGKNPAILVSTQLVEAGVDIDFDIVVRDLAPFDSIIQSAGRCNRNFNKEGGVVKIVNLQDENGKYYHQWIYDRALMDQTEKLLKNAGDVIDESSLLIKAREYYSKLKKVSSDWKSKELYESVCGLNFNGDEKSLSSFKLIQEDFWKADVFIELDDEARYVWKEYCRIMDTPLERLEKRAELLKIRKDFYKFIISIPLKILVKNLPPRINEQSWIYYVSKDQLKEYYDVEVGFKSAAGRALW